MVYVEGEASPTQWFWTRDTAQRILYVVANGNEMNNGLETRRSSTAMDSPSMRANGSDRSSPS